MNGPHKFGTEFGSDNAPEHSAAIVSHHDSIKWFEAIPGEQLCIRVHGTQVNGRYAIMENIAAPGTATPMHFTRTAESVHVQPRGGTFAPSSAEEDAVQKQLTTFNATQAVLDASFDKNHGEEQRCPATCDARGAAYSRNVDTADFVGPLYSTIKLAIWPVAASRAEMLLPWC